MRECLIKSRKRVRDHGEVFTPSHIVKDMCDLIPEEAWTIESKFLEPTCGNGNFLVEIYARKLALCKDVRQGLKALGSIYGIDIMQDNVDESRSRLLTMLVDKFPNITYDAVMIASAILKNNIRCGDSLEIQKEWATT